MAGVATFIRLRLERWVWKLKYKWQMVVILDSDR